ncbi:MAG: LicD family protein [Oscillospiraceae bacterium]|nr:LicD family protein [Oscillospiraceae bacterium]
MNYSTTFPSTKSDAVPMTTDEVRDTLLAILGFFTDFCNRNNLYYFLAGGTLLGAIRHKGFIPWDDDIDVFMPRPDYERMHDLIRTQGIGSDRYVLIGLRAGAGTWPFAKIIDLETRVEAEYVAEEQSHLWIDIFPVDGLPSDPVLSDRHLQKAGFMKHLYGIATARLGHGKTVLHSMGKIPVNLLLRVYGAGRLAQNIDAHAKKYSFVTSDFVGNVVWSVGNGERVAKEVFSTRTQVEFCGRNFYGPAAWDRYLSSVYGNYMQLPPSEKQKSNHDITVFRNEP